MNDQINQSPTNQELEPKKKHNKTILIIGIVIGMLLAMGIGYYLGTTGFFNNNKIDHIENDEEVKVDNNNSVTMCGVSEKFILDSIKELDSKFVLYKYFPDFYKPFDSTPEYVKIYPEQIFNPGLKGEEGCIVSERYIYLKSDNKVYSYDPLDDNVFKNINDYNSLILWIYLKDYVLYNDIREHYRNYCSYETDYDYSETYNVEIRECVPIESLKYAGKLIATYTVDLNTKEYTVEDYQ